LAEQDQRRGQPSAGAIAGGYLDGQAEVIRQIGEPMIKRAPSVARFVLKRIPDGPGYVYDIASAAAEKDKLRGAFGVAGSLLGGAGGGALGAAAGGVNAPIGAAIGSAFGDQIGKDIYDENRDQIRRGVGDMKSWMNRRWNELQGR
jgi:hypothetical protein